MKYLVQFLDLFIPRFCPACKSKLTIQEHVICNLCFSKIKITDAQRTHHEFERKFQKEKIINDFITMFVFEKDKELQQVIHELKYNGKFAIGIFLGKELTKRMSEQVISWEIDMIIPVPLHQLKKAERGYNQSAFIGKGISSALNIPLRTDIIKRIRYTETQTTMNLAERKENMEGAFKCRNFKSIIGKNILLIDDVITTGATISECGQVLKDNGADKICAASIAIAD